MEKVSSPLARISGLWEMHWRPESGLVMLKSRSLCPYVTVTQWNLVVGSLPIRFCRLGSALAPSVSLWIFPGGDHHVSGVAVSYSTWVAWLSFLQQLLQLNKETLQIVVPSFLKEQNPAEVCKELVCVNFIIAYCISCLIIQLQLITGICPAVWTSNKQVSLISEQ